MDESGDESIVMEPERPAGFFSTFSIADPDGSAREGLGRTQRRNRRVFVCIPCHRRKLRCDKNQPCSRCVASGSPADCIYQQVPGTKQEAAEPEGTPRPEAQPARRLTTPDAPRGVPKARLEGATHWNSVAKEFSEAWPYVEGSDPQWRPRHQQILGIEALFPSLPNSNFPFGSAFSLSQNRAQALESLPPPQIINALIQSYFGTFESTHRLIHRQEFADELNAFWINNDQLSEEWLAQFNMMLALGCQATPGRIFAGTGRSVEDWTDVFLDGAQFFLGRSPYFASPTLTTIRTLCLVVIARMMEIVKGSEMTHPVFLMGFVVRLAMTMQLHRKIALLPETTTFEAEMRKRIWVTVQLLDLDVAMRTGTSYLYREQDADRPLNLNDADFHRNEHGWVIQPRWATSGALTDSTFQIKLASFLPILTEVVNTINSPTSPTVDQDKLRSWDGQIRQKLQDAESVLKVPPYAQAGNADKVSTQLNFLKVLVHRTLLGLHFSYVCALRAGQFRDSTIYAMQSSLALLRMQHTWNATPRNISGGVQTRTSSTSTSTFMESLDQPTVPFSWLSDLCHDDFGIATSHLILTLRWGGFDDINNQSGLPTRSGASAILRQSLELQKARACRSVSHFREYVGLSILAGCLRSIEMGEPMLQTLLEVAGQIEQTVLQGRQDLLWTQGNNPFSGQAGLPAVPFGYGGYGQ